MQETDRYGCKVATLIDPRDLTEVNLAMVQQGQAAAYRRYCSDARYTQAQRAARGARLGICSQPGEHQWPWGYRC